jgi:hypothetical protein
MRNLREFSDQRDDVVAIGSDVILAEATTMSPLNVAIDKRVRRSSESRGAATILRSDCSIVGAKRRDVRRDRRGSRTHGVKVVPRTLASDKFVERQKER